MLGRATSFPGLLVCVLLSHPVLSDILQSVLQWWTKYPCIFSPSLSPGLVVSLTVSILGCGVDHLIRFLAQTTSCCQLPLLHLMSPSTSDLVAVHRRSSRYCLKVGWFSTIHCTPGVAAKAASAGSLFFLYPGPPVHLCGSSCCSES